MPTRGAPPSKPDEIADHAEARAWGTQQPVTLYGIAEEVGGGFEPSDEDEDEMTPRESIYRADDGLAKAQEALEILADRARILGDRYPFRLEGTSISCLRPVAPYLYLLALALADSNRITLDIRETQFEAFAASAVSGYFGGGSIVLTGARSTLPWDEKLSRLRTLLSEMPEPVKSRPTGIEGMEGDEGLDFVFVKPFADGRPSRIVVCGNCATGRNNWRSKGKETEPDHFFRYFFQRAPDAVSLLAIAVPFIPSDNELSRKLGRDVLLFDRLRLSEFASEVPQGVIPWLAGVRDHVGEIALT